MLILVGQLHATERACPPAGRGHDEARRAAGLRRRATLRAEQSAPIIAEIRAWAHRQRALPESSLGKAIGYMLGLSPPRTLCHDAITCRLLGSLRLTRDDFDSILPLYEHRQ